MYNILVCGSRGFSNKSLMVKRLNAFLEQHNLDETNIQIISGMARGADALAAEIAKDNNVPLIEMPADWKAHGKRAGFVRNLEMLNKADIVIAFWDGESVGTAHTIQEAKKKNITTYVVHV